MASLTAARRDVITIRPATREAPGMVQLTAMEIRKLAHRPLTWAIFALPVTLAAFWFPLAYLTSRAQGTLATFGAHLFPPGSIEGTFEILAMLGPICVAVLAAGLIGSDYGWGLMRVQVGTGVPRARLLGGKLTALGVVLTAWIVTSLAATTLSSVAVTLVSGHALSFGTVDATWFAQLGLMIGRTWLVLAAWMSIAAAASVVGRSLASGIAAPIVWQVLEGILVSVLGLAGHFGAHISGLLIMTNARGLAIHNVFGRAQSVAGTVSQTHATVVLAGYVLLMLAVAVALFIRRDYTASA